MLILARHGRTEANAHGLLQGHLDLPLDEVGARQAEALGRVLWGAEEFISSPLQRAMMTATAMSASVRVDARWIELDYGTYDGRPIGDVPDAVWQAWRNDPDFTVTDGESMGQLTKRVREACIELAEVAATRDVVIVSHVSPIKAAISWALGASGDAAGRMYLDHASVSRIGFGRFGPFLHSFNDTSHLALMN